MSGPEPTARIDLPFAPDRVLWGAGDSQLLVAGVGGTNPVASISIRPGRARIGWTDEGEFPGAKVTAVAAGPRHGLLAVAETVTVPHDPEPFERLRVLDLATGRRRWFRNYEYADELAIGAGEPPLLLARSRDRIKIWDLGDLERTGSHPVSVSWGTISPRLWCPGPAAYAGRLVVGAPPFLIDVTTGDATPLDLPHGWDWIRIAWTGDPIVALGWTSAPRATVILATLDPRDGSLRESVERETTAGSGKELAIAASPDAGRLAYAAGDELAMLTLPDLRPAPGFRPVALADAPDDHRRQVRFGSKGDAVAVNRTRSGSGVTLVDAAIGECLWQHATDVSDLDFSPGGREVLIREGARLSWYDISAVSSGSWTRKKHWALPGTPHAMAMTTIRPEGERPWTLLGAVGVHDAGKGLEYFRWVESGEGKREYNPAARTTGLAFGPDRYVVWQAGGDNDLVCRTLNHELVRRWTGTRAVTAAAFVKNRRLAAVRSDNLVRFHEIDEDEPGTVELGGAVRLLAVAPGASVIAVAGHNQTWLLDPAGAPLHKEPITTSGDVTALAFDRKPTRLLIAHRNSAVAEVDLESGGIVREHPHEAPVQLAVVGPAGRLLVTGAVDNKVRVIPLSAASEERPYLWPFAHPVKSVGFHPRDRVVVVATEEPHLAMYNLDDGLEFWWTPLPAAVHEVAISDDGDVIAVACDDGVHFYGRRR